MYQTYYAEAGSTHDVSYSCGIIGYTGRKEIKDTSACIKHDVYFVLCSF